MFLCCILLAPFAALLPIAATAPALITVGFLMSAQITKIDWRRFDTALPAFMTMTLIPFTYSIAHGIGYGFIVYAVIKLLTGRIRDVHPLMGTAAGLFAMYFLWAR